MAKPGGDWPWIRDSPYPFLGRIIDGRYMVEQFLDSGTSGHVYRARALSFNRHFAIKIVDTRRYEDEAVRDKMIERFHREVDSISQIQNPHVIDVFEAIELDESIYGLVMSYVDGQTLDQYLVNKGPLSQDEAVSLAAQIANGLQEAHSRGLIHRDIKPENVMVEELPASGIFARILDFGIALSVESGERDYGFQGTPLYASPEQCTEEQVPDARSDIYSLGCLFYYLLTGHPPFAFTNALRVMDGHVYQRRPRLSEAEGGGEFPESLENFVAHLMARNPDDRPPNLRLVHEDLASFLKGRPMAHYGAAPPDRKGQSLGLGSELDAKSPVTPPPQDFISLSERKSGALADEPTTMDPIEIPKWTEQSEIEMELIREIPVPFGGPENSPITASALDPRGLACVFADATPSVYLMELGPSAFHQSFEQEYMVSAVELDLHNGFFVVADVGGTLSEREPGSGRPLSTHQLACSPLALELRAVHRKLYYGTERGELHLLDLRTGSGHEVLRFPHAISTLQSGDNDSLLVGLWDGSMACIGGDEELKWHLPVAPDSIADVGFLDHDRYFAIDSQGTLHTGNVRRGTVESSSQIGPGLRTMRRLADGGFIALSLFAATLQVWRVQTP